MKRWILLFVVLTFVFSFAYVDILLKKVDKYFFTKIAFYAAKTTEEKEMYREKAEKLKDRILKYTEKMIEKKDYEGIENFVKQMYFRYNQDLIVIMDLVKEIEKLLKSKVLTMSDWQLTKVLVLVQQIEYEFRNVDVEAYIQDAVSRWKNGKKDDEIVGSSQSQNTGGTTKKAKWLVLVYINADNDLESAGIDDINEMERVGSDDDVKIVVQIDRAEGYDASNGDWTGARRYYITLDIDNKKIGSRLLADLGEVDMGAASTLVDFAKWGMKNFPAERVALVIWNHGAGWKAPIHKGVSYDESSGNNLDFWALKSALRQIRDVHGGKLDVIAFDACLMGMIEVAYQLKDFAHVMIGSEQTEPGDGWPYDEILARLKKKPDMDGREFAKNVVEAYVKSYEGGIQGWGKVTQAAIDLDRIDELAKAVDNFAVRILELAKKSPEVLSLIAKARLQTRDYDDPDYCDLLGFVYNVSQLLKSKDQEIGRLALEVIKTQGIELVTSLQDKNKKIFNDPIHIEFSRPAEIHWGINGWKVPDKKYWPFGSKLREDKKCVVTPFRKEGNKWVVEIGPFIGDERVDEINYVIHYLDDDSWSSEGKIKNASVVYSSGVVFAEGHTPEMAGSFGLSVYVPSVLNYMISYKNLDWAAATHWDELISLKPKFVRNGNALLVMNQGSLYANMVYGKYYAQILRGAGYVVDIWIPEVFGPVNAKVLKNYRDAVVFWSVGGNPASISRFEVAELYKFLRGGGRVVMMGVGVEQLELADDALRRIFKVEFARDVEGVKLRLEDEVFALRTAGANTAMALPTVFDVVKSGGAKTEVVGEYVSGDKGTNFIGAAVILTKTKRSVRVISGVGLENFARVDEAAKFVKSVAEKVYVPTLADGI